MAVHQAKCGRRSHVLPLARNGACMTASRILTLTAIFIAGIAAVLAQAFAWSNAYYLKRAQDSGRSTLAFVVGVVDQAIARFSPIAGLIADEPAIRQLLKQDAATGLVPFANEKLRQVALSIDASEVYVLDPTGLTVAASNYRDPDSFVGRNFSYRPYFVQSLGGKSSMFHALGTTSGERGFFFAAPILDGIEVIGVLTVKITADAIERDWRASEQEILIADGNGIVFMTSRPDYRYRALAPLSEAIRNRISTTRQYPLERIEPMRLAADVIGPSAVQVTIGDGSDARQYLSQGMPLALAGWHAIVFTPMSLVRNQVLRTLALVAFGLMVVALSVLLLVQRRGHILQKMRIEQQERALLEERVRERTADLDTANAKLRTEVQVRRNAEERLRRSQKDLVQAGKLAALGKMSAAISHEINQPLTAIKSYADNASEFLARSRIAEAATNIASISEMADRMVDISRHLRTFARQPGDTLKPVNVTDVLNDTAELLAPQLRASAARLNYAPDRDWWVRGGKLRLQQVIVNIVNNALEAMKDQDNPVIDIEVSALDDTVRIAIRDHGPGFAQDVMDQVFDAFYTTKDAARGMGLGMSISHNIISDFGGSLTAANHPGGGAVFTVTLQAHHAPIGAEAEAMA